MVAQPAEKSCGESVQPFLASILEEVMGPVSSGFSEVRALFEKEVDELSQSFHATQDSVQLKEVGEQAGEFPAALGCFPWCLSLTAPLLDLPLSPSPPIPSPPSPFESPLTSLSPLSFSFPSTYLVFLPSTHVTHPSIHS